MSGGYSLAVVCRLYHCGGLSWGARALGEKASVVVASGL